MVDNENRTFKGNGAIKRGSPKQNGLSKRHGGKRD